jgi:hypothetical protein
MIKHRIQEAPLYAREFEKDKRLLREMRLRLQAYLLA